MKILFSLPFFVLSLTSFAGGFFPEARSYRFSVFPSYEECLKYREDHEFFMNCYQTVDFETDGRSEVVVTDMVNTGTYEIKGEKVIIKMENAADAPEEMIFLILDGGGKLKLEGTDQIWERAERS